MDQGRAALRDHGTGPEQSEWAGRVTAAARRHGQDAEQGPQCGPHVTPAVGRGLKPAGIVEAVAQPRHREPEFIGPVRLPVQVADDLVDPGSVGQGLERPPKRLGQSLADAGGPVAAEPRLECRGGPQHSPEHFEAGRFGPGG